ncbi:MAG: PH domain-containing protein, partial [Actinomycetota bacterium]
EGFIAKRSMEIPLDKINDVRFEQGIFERIVGAGTLVIQSASESGRNEFSFIRHPEEVQKTIYHASEVDQRPPTPVAAPAAAPPPAPAPGGTAPNVTTELERLAELRAKGVLTEEEFQAQKARILGGGS